MKKLKISIEYYSNFTSSQVHMSSYQQQIDDNIKEQDEILDQISDQVKGLNDIAITIGDETQNQTKMLTELESDIDQTQVKMKSNIHKIGSVQELYQEHKCPCITIIILLIILFVLIIILLTTK